jgi:DNA-binding NarL/FixJ family response regulator
MLPAFQTSSVADRVPLAMLSCNEVAPVHPRALIVSDVRFVHEGLSDVLRSRSNIVLAATAENRAEARERALALRPDAILLDARLAGSIGIVADLAAAVPDIPIIAVAVAETEHEILALIEAGIAGYVRRSASIGDLIDIIMRTLRGEEPCFTSFSGPILRRLRQLAAAARQDGDASTAGRLTPRERQVAELVAERLSNKQIARKLNIEVATVKAHMHNVLDKLKFQRRDDLARWVRR